MAAPAAEPAAAGGRSAPADPVPTPSVGRSMAVAVATGVAVALAVAATVYAIVAMPLYALAAAEGSQGLARPVIRDNLLGVALPAGALSGLGAGFAVGRWYRRGGRLPTAGPTE